MLVWSANSISYMLLRLIQHYNLDLAIITCKTYKNPDADENMYGITPLIAACNNICHIHDGQNVEVKWINLIELLLIRGSNPNHLTQTNYTSVTVFIQQASTFLSEVFAKRILRILLQYGANVNANPHTLYYAVIGINPHPCIIKILLQYNVAINCAELVTIKNRRKSEFYTNKPNLIAIQYMLEYGWQKYETDYQEHDEVTKLKILLDTETTEKQLLITRMKKLIQQNLVLSSVIESAQTEQTEQTEQTDPDDWIIISNTID